MECNYVEVMDTHYDPYSVIWNKLPKELRNNQEAISNCPTIALQDSMTDYSLSLINLNNTSTHFQCALSIQFVVHVNNIFIHLLITYHY